MLKLSWKDDLNNPSLFHFTGLQNLLRILEQNRLGEYPSKSYFETLDTKNFNTYDVYDPRYPVSLTRKPDLNFLSGGGPLTALELDRNKLRQRFPLVPHNYNRLNPSLNPESYEAEERTRVIENLNEYLKNIIISKSQYETLFDIYPDLDSQYRKENLARLLNHPKLKLYDDSGNELTSNFEYGNISRLVPHLEIRPGYGNPKETYKSLKCANRKLGLKDTFAAKSVLT